MKFTSPNGKLDSPELLQEYESAQVFDKLRVGSSGVFFPAGLGTKYIPYDFMERIFLRINEVNGRTCCATAKFYYFRVVFVHEGKEYADYLTENENAANAAIEALKAAAPNVAFGYIKAEE